MAKHWELVFRIKSSHVVFYRTFTGLLRVLPCLCQQAAPTGHHSSVRATSSSSVTASTVMLLHRDAKTPSETGTFSGLCSGVNSPHGY